MNEAQQPPFPKGTWVRRRSDTSAVGQVDACQWNDQLGGWRVHVVFGDGRRGVPASALEAFEPRARNLWGDFRQGAFGSRRQFVTLMTHERLKHPPAAIGNALGSARARFYPHQFKPLLKFLDHPSHRLLVADDVGLGKTIEAGYILREWRARREVTNVLALVPARLRTKWQNELNTKFGESFEVVDAAKFRSLARRVSEGAEPEPFAWVASYESLRGEATVELLNECALPLDFLILDEAHRVRNVNTWQHRLARALVAGAEAAVFLTATPVQTKLEDLYRLLDLLDPGAYGSESTFSEVLEANRPIVTAARLAADGRFSDAAAKLSWVSESPHTAGLYKDPAFADVVTRLVETRNPTRDDQIRMQQEIADFSLTGAIISRTRKSEVMVDRPIRDPQTPVLTMSEAEEAIYKAVARFVKVLFPLASDWGQKMAALQFYRITASCIPAAAEMMGRKVKGEGWRALAEAIIGELDDEEGDDGAATLAIERAGNLSSLETELLAALVRAPSRDEDRKYRELRTILDRGWREDDAAGRRRRKVVVFANFRSTLLYLSRALTADGVQTRLIHGLIAIADRENAIAEFLDLPGVNVLLSSEVGGEGLDLQVADTVVNYDLPWNPMVVEQRIGRVDRIGQRSPRIRIVNLVLAGTVEERIVARLYERIGLFEETIGEIDDILGRRVEELVVEALSHDLTPEEMERQAVAAADALKRQMNDLDAVNRRTDDLISADQALLDEVDQLQRRRRVPEPREIETLLLQFLEQRYPGVRLQGDAVKGTGVLELPAGVRRDFMEWARAASPEAFKWGGKLTAGQLTVTFDPEVALRHTVGRVEHLQAKHPLVQYAVHRLTDEIRQQGETFAVRLSSPALPLGTWALGVWALDVQGNRRERRLATAAVELTGDRVLVGDNAEAFLVEALATGEELDPRPRVASEVLTEAADRLRAAVGDDLARTIREGREGEARRLARRRTTWGNTLQRRVDRQRELLERLRALGRRDAILKMHAGKLQKMETELRAKMAEFDVEPDFDIEEQEVCALLVVNQPEDEVTA